MVDSSAPVSPAPAREASLAGIAWQVLPSLAGLAIVGHSLVQLFLELDLAPDRRVAFFTGAQVAVEHPTLALARLTGFLPLLIAIAVLLVDRVHGVLVVRSTARVIAPAGVAFLLPALFTWQFGQQRPIAYLIL